MARSKFKSERKVSGGRYRAYRKKKVRDLARDPTLTKVSKQIKRNVRQRSGKIKQILLSTEFVNVYDPKEKKYKKAKIKTVVENTANRHLVRRNILTKGAIVDTEVGKVKIVNRPGQEGMVNAVLVK